MSDTQLYKDHLLDHFKNPRNKSNAEFTDKSYIKRGSNPRCGDDIEIGFNIIDNHIEAIEFRGRGCSVCLASASMMTEALADSSVKEAGSLALKMSNWVAGEDVLMPEQLQPLSAVKHHPARKKCVMLCWNALHEGLEDHYV